MAEIVKTENLVTNFYTYEGVVKALNKVSLVVDRGSTFGLVGESGCGKSVTVRSIMRIVQAPGRIEGGKVIVFLDNGKSKAGVDLLQQSEAYMESLRGDSISMIFQEPNAALNPTLTIGDQISESFLFHQFSDICSKVLDDLASPENRTFFPWKAYLSAVYGVGVKNPKSLILKMLDKTPILRYWRKKLHAEALSRSVDIVRRLGIPNPERIVGQYPHNLSGGMKQRIVIAIALACNPALLIADEATSNLDVTIQAQILDLLRRLKEEVISSILLITHDLGVVAETCDRVGVMYAGSLCEVGDVKDLFRNPLHPYARALLDSVPKYSVSGELQSIEGTVPNLVNPPSGCRFHPRCPNAMDICSREEPPLTTPDLSEEQYEQGGENHLVACHLYKAKKGTA